jgi:methionyl-tRNA formyltransferase
MKVVFFGSSSFSVPSLLAVSRSVSMVVTRRSKPKGRGYLLDDNEVKRAASELGLPVTEIDSLKDEAMLRLRETPPDLFVVVSFGLIIPRWLLDLPTTGSINVHPSLLPLYRGPAPMQWALLNGDRGTGITVMKMTEKMDAGNILYQEKTPILDGDTIVSLSERMALRSAGILVPLLDDIGRTGMPEGTPQDDASATYTPIITKEMGEIDWNRPAREIVQKVRAFLAWPTAYSFLDGKMLKVFEAGEYAPAGDGKPGVVLSVSREGILVPAMNRMVLLKEVQLENKKRMDACQFANGYRGLAGKMLGR